MQSCRRKCHCSGCLSRYCSQGLHSLYPEEIYKQEIHENADLNGDGVIGRPSASPDDPEDSEDHDKENHLYKEEEKLGRDLDGDGFIGDPANGVTVNGKTDEKATADVPTESVDKEK